MVPAFCRCREQILNPEREVQQGRRYGLEVYCLAMPHKVKIWVFGNCYLSILQNVLMKAVDMIMRLLGKEPQVWIKVFKEPGLNIQTDVFRSILGGASWCIDCPKRKRI